MKCNNGFIGNAKKNEMSREKAQKMKIGDIDSWESYKH
jgi:hypothetical protein